MCYNYYKSLICEAVTVCVWILTSVQIGKYLQKCATGAEDSNVLQRLQAATCGSLSSMCMNLENFYSQNYSTVTFALLYCSLVGL